ncbi:MAG: dienelactone hydrolase family protein [Myxococcota bacterium]
MTHRVAIIGVAWACAVAACSDDDADAPDLSCGGQVAYANSGPFPVGVTTLQLDDVSVEVWYPASAAGDAFDAYDLRDWIPEALRTMIPDAEAPIFETRAFRDMSVRSGSFPVVVFSHGLGGFRSQSTFFTTHLASWGFVVAAPDHPERGLALLFTPATPASDQAPITMLQTLERLRSENADATSPFFERLDLDKVAVAGHSAGGSAAAVAALDSAVDTWVGHAGARAQGAGKPALVISGATDDIVTAPELRSTFDAMSGPNQRYFSIFGAGHLAFSDICLIAQDEGGLIPFARRFGIEIPVLFESLATDGCEADDLPAPRAWPVINHYSTAHLFEALELPNAVDGFTDEAASCFAPLVLDAAQR